MKTHNVLQSRGQMYLFHEGTLSPTWKLWEIVSTCASFELHYLRMMAQRQHNSVYL